jgi:hypothetical protein
LKYGDLTISKRGKRGLTNGKMKVISRRGRKRGNECEK